MKKIICFDLWLTLVKEPYSIADYWSPLLTAYPEIKKEKLISLIDKIPMKNPLSIEESVRRILAEINSIKDDQLAKEISDRWKYSCSNVELFKNSIPTLEKFRQQGHTLVLITNTSKFGWQQVKNKFSLDKYFDLVVKSFEVGLVKPEPQIFSYVEQKLNMPKDQFIMIGDSLENDVLASKEQGWDAILLQRDDHCKNKDKCISSLTELIKYV